MDPQQLSSELRSHFLNLYSLALSDHEFNSEELELLFKIGEERGVPKEDIERIILYPDKVEFSIPDDIIGKVEYLYDFAQMIWADGELHQYEKAALEKFCIAFGFQKSNIQHISEFLIEEARKKTSPNIIFDLVNENITK